MKIRIEFVTNSSSESFVCIGAEVSLTQKQYDAIKASKETILDVMRNKAVGINDIIVSEVTSFKLEDKSLGDDKTLFAFGRSLTNLSQKEKELSINKLCEEVKKILDNITIKHGIYFGHVDIIADTFYY